MCTTASPRASDRSGATRSLRAHNQHPDPLTRHLTDEVKNGGSVIPGVVCVPGGATLEVLGELIKERGRVTHDWIIAVGPTSVPSIPITRSGLISPTAESALERHSLLGHDERESCWACRWDAVGVDLGVALLIGVASRLGHTSVRTVLDVYGHLYEGLDRDAADALVSPWDASHVAATWSRADYADLTSGL